MAGSVAVARSRSAFSMKPQKLLGENSSIADSAAWDRIWKLKSHPYVLGQAARAKSKIETLIKDGLEFDRRDRVLDLGCGTGDGLTEAAQRLSSESRFVACDFSPVAVGLARANFRGHGLAVEVICADAAALPLRDGSIDKVLLLMTLQHVRDEIAVLSEVDRVLAQHGELFVALPGERSIISMSQRLRSFITAVPIGRRTSSMPRAVALLGSRFRIDACHVSQVGPDRWLSRMIDRTLARVVPEWGRYIMLRCSKLTAP